MRCPRCGVEILTAAVLAQDGQTRICAVCAFIEELGARDLPEAIARMNARLNADAAARP